MLKYIVLFKFRDPEECLPTVIEKLHSMEGVIPEILSMETGADIWHNGSRSYDLALTCTGDLSRNRQVGLRLGQGESLEHITSSLGMVAEGGKTTSAVYDLARRLGVETPVTDTVQGLLHGGESPREAVMRLMTRTLRQE